MGTTTFYLRYNDFGRKLNDMTKKERRIFDDLSPYKNENEAFGWKVPLELHNGNIYVLVFWQGRLMKLECAPKELNKKYYSRYRGKTIREYEWTILKKYIENNLSNLDKEFKKIIRKDKKTKISQKTNRKQNENK